MRTQIKQNQFWMASFLTFFILAFSSQDILAQTQKTQQINPQKENKPSNSTDSDASLEETVNWIKGVLEPNSITNFNIGGDEIRFTRVRDVKFEGCKLKYIVDMLPGSSVLLSSTATSRNQFLDLKDVFSRGFTVSLDKLDPLGITIKPYFPNRSTPYFVQLHSNQGQKVVTETVYSIGWIYRNIYDGKEFYDFDKEYDRPQDTAALFAKDEEFAKRLQRAFKHAITLCGGKVDPF